MNRQTASSSTIRHINRAAVLDFVWQNRVSSCTQIARKLNISQTTAVRIVDELIRYRLVHSAGFRQETPVGRPHALLEFNGSAFRLLSLDLGGDRLLGVEIDLSGNILQEIYSPVQHLDGESTLKEVVQLIERLMVGSSAEGMLLGIGLGVPGIVIPEQGLVTWAARLNWRNLPLRDLLKAKFNLPIVVENDVNLAALAEQSFGVGRDVSCLACIAVGYGIGAGLIIDGKLHRGSQQSAGEIGYLVPDLEYLGQQHETFGVLESLAASSGIRRRAEELFRQDPAGRLPNSLEDIFLAARRGEHWAQTLMSEIADYLTIAVISLSATLDPEIISIGGSLAPWLDILIEPIRQQAEKLLPGVPKIVISPLGDKATVMGVIHLAVANIFDWVLPQQSIPV